MEEEGEPLARVEVPPREEELRPDVERRAEEVQEAAPVERRGRGDSWKSLIFEPKRPDGKRQTRT